MSKRDYKTSIADGMELEPLGGTGAGDKENPKTNGTKLDEGKWRAKKKPLKLLDLNVCARIVVNLFWPRAVPICVACNGLLKLFIKY